VTTNEWSAGVLGAVCRFVHDQIQGDPESVPDFVEAEAMSGTDWRFKIRVDFYRVEELPEETVARLFRPEGDA
jgi:hypothetical protein